MLQITQVATQIAQRVSVHRHVDLRYSVVPFISLLTDEGLIHLVLFFFAFDHMKRLGQWYDF